MESEFSKVTKDEFKNSSFLAKKPTMTKKQKLPEIRQTLTSKYRLLKANPLLLHEMEQKMSTTSSEFLDVNKSLRSIAVALEEKPKNSTNSKVLNKKEKCNNFKPFLSKRNLKPTNTKLAPKPPVRTDSLKNTSSTSTYNRIHNGKIDFVARNKQAFKTTTSSKFEFKKPEPKVIQGKRPISAGQKDIKSRLALNQKPTIRRSLSAEYFDRLRKTSTTTVLKTKSSEEILKNGKQVIGVSPIVEEDSINEMSFKTPMAYERRSTVFKTPNTGNSKYSFTMTPSNTLDLQQRLNTWLKKRGKSLGDFHHLRCFGVHANKSEISKVDIEDKENVEIELIESESYEDLSIIGKTEEESDLVTIAKAALVDLYKLIHEGYPQEHCEAWLSLMRKKYKHIEDEPQYWECRAAIEQARGSISSAVEYYQTAIIQGAEVQAVDESLDQLLRKFSLLNIDAKNDKSKDRARIVKDARNIFKSSIIQFAVQERSLKKKTKNPENEKDVEKKMFIATPVRRSTRLSRSGYTSTPGIKIYSSLKEVEAPIKESIDFQANLAL